MKNKIIGLIIKELDTKTKENIERQVPYDELVTLLMTLKIEEYKPFRFNNKNHQLLFCEKEEGMGLEFHKSTELDGFDIYVWKSIIETKKILFRIALAHELAEIAIINLFVIKDDRKIFLTVKESHEMACDIEKRFADELLGKNGILRKEYEDFAAWLYRLSD